MKFFDNLAKNDQEQVKQAFAHGFVRTEIAGPAKLYRFIGFEVYGRWWFSEKVFQDLKAGAKNLGVPLRDFAKARMALPDAFNDKLHVFEMDIPHGISLPALSGRVNYQRMTGKPLSEKEDRRNGDHILLIGGYDQYFLDPETIRGFHLRQVLFHG